ncbi:MAG TPA: N-acetylmuramoyl-L-alanine amidase [Candidatus Merdenecus merdavium]|nr:N-acetylmuramoyl-L-alanine amidase [Candidatus Merdenecus merdavium]
MDGRYQRMKRRRQEQILRRTIMVGIVGLIVLLMVFLINKMFFHKRIPVLDRAIGNIETSGALTKVIEERPEFDVQLLTPNEYSRPGMATDSINGIVVHYTANPGSTAQNNRDYFENLKDTHDTKASSHFVIGIEGEIIQCIPSNEVAYASNQRNNDTISIEVCHPDETGKFTDATYESLVRLVAWLCGRFDLQIDDIIRHYDVTGKNCPKYYVEHEDAWEKLKEDVEIYIYTYGVDPSTITEKSSVES